MKRRRGQGPPPACPKCGAGRVVEIVYGEPSPETGARAERGELVLGGCCIMGDGSDPKWHCRGCATQFNVER